MNVNTPTPEPSAAAGRDHLGRFCKGNRFGPGNPHARSVAALRSALLKAVTPEHMARIAARLVEDAENGDHAATKLLLAYTLGRPAESVDPDTLDVREMNLYQQEVIPVDAFLQMHSAIPVNALLALWRILQPCHAAQALDRMGDLLDPDQNRKHKAPAPEAREEAAAPAAPEPPRPPAAPAPRRPAPSPNGGNRARQRPANPAASSRRPQPSANGADGGAAVTRHEAPPSPNGADGDAQVLARWLALFRGSGATS